MWDYSTEKIFKLSTGYPKGNEAGTVMAMATMGNPEKYYDWFKNFKNNINNPLIPSSEKDSFDMASSLQKVTEDIVKYILDPYIGKYKNICFSGGVSLNCVMIGKMLDWWKDINIYCDPVPYDGGLSLGCARYMWHQILDKPRIKWKNNSTSYLGRIYSKQEILSEINKQANKYIIINVDDKYVVNLLLNQKIIAVFGGGSESGRRALGNRSILVDPRDPKMKDYLNEKVKHRKYFRPFAPSILREEVKNWFEHDIDSPYMSFAIKFKENMKSKVPAVVHYDGTARLQTVCEKDNKWYYNFIKKWYKKSGVPIILNTSFNDREPIVETPEHAVNTFINTDIDALYFYDYGILLKKQI